MSKKLFVGNLPFEVNDADLATVLAVAGTVVTAKVIINNKTGRSKGYGFVEMETEEMADQAVKKFEGATLNERSLTVALATPKQEAAAKTDAAGETPSAETTSVEVSSADATSTAAQTSSNDTAGDSAPQA